MNERLLRSALALLLVTASLRFTAYVRGDSPFSPTTHPPMLQVTSGSTGSYLTDGTGKSVYLFEADRGLASSCNGSCAQLWPPYTVPRGESVTAGNGTLSSLISTITRNDGTTQVIYDGHPLYYYADDTAPGQTNGQGFTSFGAAWYLVKGDGAALNGPYATPAPSPSSR
jgi:predicted lipoprotein with Yx(FWY)xxD motif